MIRIGLVEDNTDYRDNLAFFLRREGFDIAFESDGHEIAQPAPLGPTEALSLLA